MSGGFVHSSRRWLGVLAAVMLGALSLQARASDLDDIDRAERTGWNDPAAALAILDRIEPGVKRDADLAQLLTVRGMLAADQREDAAAEQIALRLQRMGERGVAIAARGAHIVRAHLDCQSDRLDAARKEIAQVVTSAADSPLERYRAEVLRGSVLEFVGEQELTMHSYEVALDIARDMRSVPRQLRALKKLVHFKLRLDNLERVDALIATSRGLARDSGDDAAVAWIAIQQASVADKRGDRRGQRAAILEAVEYANKAGSDSLRSIALGYIADFDLKMGNYREALRYSEQGLELARRLRSNGLEPTIEFNMGEAKIGLGELAAGKQLIEHAIEQTRAGGNVADADEMLREYGDALERAGDLRGAIAVYHRSEQQRDQLMNTARQRAILELTAKFDDERKTREIDLLKRDNALKSANLRAQQMRQVMTMLVAAVVVALAFVLGWAFNRVRRLNERLRHASEHDTLTGLRNRRYFNEKVLSRHADRPFEGCVLLIDLDHFKRINDLFGHPGGDAVLQAIAKRLAQSLRDFDTLVRWGGEEFLAVLPPLSRENLTATVRRLLAAVQDKPVMWRGQSIPCTISIGYAAFPVEAGGAELSLNRAIAVVDKALYEAKKRGRNRACSVTSVRPEAGGDLASINAAFDDAVAGNVVQLEDFGSARASS